MDTSPSTPTTEPRIDEMLDDAVIKAVMQRDGVGRPGRVHRHLAFDVDNSGLIDQGELDTLAAHVDAELRLDPDDLAKAAAAPAASFTVGAPVPLPAIFVATSDVSASPSPSSLC